MEPKFDIKVKWVDDDSPDNSYLGEYKSRLTTDEAYINRKTGVFVVPGIEWVEKTFDTQEQADKFMEELRDLELDFDDFEEGDKIVVSHEYYQEVSTRYGRNEYEFYVSCNYPHPKPDEYQYFIQDFKRLESYGDDWWSMGCIVTASLNGVELGQASVWGFESDMDEESKKEAEDDVAAQAEDDAKKNLEGLLSTIKEQETK